MKTIVIGDIHGCYDELKTLLFNLEVNGEYKKETDKLIFLGDYIDRGKNSRLVIEFIRNLQKDNENVIALKGNHEDMLLDHYDCKNSYWTLNGYEKTLESYKGFEDQLNNDVQWIRSLPLYYEDDYFVYVHAGIDVNKPMEQQDSDTLLWIREAFVCNRKKYHKKVIFGHTPTFYLTGEYEPVYTISDNIAIDTGCVYGGFLSALIIKQNKIKDFYQVEKE